MSVRGISALEIEPFGPDLGNQDKPDVTCKKSLKICVRKYCIDFDDEYVIGN